MSELASATVAPEEDVQNTATYRGLKAVVILLGALIIIAFGVLVVGLRCTRFRAKAPNARQAPKTPSPCRQGARIVSS